METKTKDQKAQAEPTSISTTLKKPLASFKEKTPTNVRFKSEAKGQRYLIEPTQEQAGQLSQYLAEIGADKNVLSQHPNEETRRQRNQMTYLKWFQGLVIKNRQFPDDIPVKFVLAHFREKVVQNDVSIKGFNLREQVRAMKEYLSEYEDELRGKWWQYQNPNARPKAIPEHTTRSKEQEAQSDQERRKNLEMIFGADEVPESLRFWK